MQVLLLGEGNVLYYGDRLAAVSWLERLSFKACGVDANPAEFILEVISLRHQDAQTKAKRLKEWADCWNKEGREFLRNWVLDGTAAHPSTLLVLKAGGGASTHVEGSRLLKIRIAADCSARHIAEAS